MLYTEMNTEQAKLFQSLFEVHKAKRDLPARERCNLDPFAAEQIKELFADQLSEYEGYRFLDVDIPLEWLEDAPEGSMATVSFMISD